MDKVKDPVCGMMLDPGEAVAMTTYESRHVYFCSDDCRREFEASPAKFYDRLEEERPYTVSKGMAAPKFGSAGSGGLENDPVLDGQYRA
jgi:YHS domain-containing protein